MKRSLPLFGPLQLDLWQFRLFPLGLMGMLLAVAVSSGSAEDKKPPSKPEPVHTQPKPLHKLTVRLLDGDHRPVAGAHVGWYTQFWPKFFEPEIADESGLMYREHAVSDQDGLARVESKDDNLLDFRGRLGLVAHHAGRGLIAYALIDADRIKTASGRPVDITLVPECHVTGKLVCPELTKRDRKIGFISVELSIDQTQFIDCRSEPNGDFHFVAPAGHYDMFAWGTYAPAPSLRQTLIVPEGKLELDLTLTVAPKKFALLMGRPAPELRDIAAWKNSPPLKLADLKGKCVLLEFWGHWCGPCIGRMPDTFALYDKYAKQGLVVIGVHVEVTDEGVDTVEKLDAKLAGVRQQRWHGRDIPFPVALARPRVPKRAAVVEDYEFGPYPTMILIDRRGNVVDIMNPNDGGLPLLQKALNEKPPDDLTPSRQN